MSTKTIKQRIALVAVSALTVGLLSVVSAPASRAADNVAPGTASPTGDASTLNIATTTNTSGVAVLGNTDNLRSSVGLLATGDLAGTRKAQTTQTATLLSNGTLVVYTSHNASLGHMITVTGGTIVDSANSQGINSSLTAVAAGYTTPSGNDLVAAIKPNAGATSMTVTLHTASALPATMLAGSATLTLAGQIFVTIATSSVSGVLAASNSGLWYSSDHTTLTQTSDDAVSGIGTAAFNVEQYANIRAQDAYGVDLAAGILTATATNGALVKIGTGDTTAVASTDFYTSAPDDTVVTVAAPGTSPVTTTVTVQWNGITIGTKTFVFTGKVAKITMSSPKSGVTGNSTSGTNTATIVFQDAAGNGLAIDNSATPAASFGSLATADLSISLSTAPTAALGYSGSITFACGSLGSTNSKIAATYTNTDGTVVTSNTLSVNCGSAAVKYAASYDKAVYAPGEIATLTVTFTDIYGKTAGDELTSSATNATDDVVVISESGVTKVGAAHAADDLRTTNGKLEYKYIVGQNEGTYTNSISFPQVNTNGASISTGAVTATLTVKNATATVTNAEVLKSIVALIASINKQIQALQKLILRR